MRPAAPGDLTGAQLVLSWTAAAAGLLALVVYTLGMIELSHFPSITLEDTLFILGGLVPAAAAARWPSWITGLLVSVLGFVPLVYAILPMPLVPVLVITTLVLCVQRLVRHRRGSGPSASR